MRGDGDEQLESVGVADQNSGCAVGAPLPSMTMTVAIAAWTVANTQNTTILAQQVGRGGQADRLFSPEDGTLADQVADGQRGAHEHRADGSSSVRICCGFVGRQR